MHTPKIHISVLALSWLALLLSAVVTGEIVIDLIYEEADLAKAQSLPATEEIESVAEDLLMPSAKEGLSSESQSTLLSIDFDASPLSHHWAGCSDNREGSFLKEWNPRSTGASCLYPFRI
ncbi:MAG: hypothetical protein ACT4OO_01765 [Nitrospiraceae bacterium]